MDLSLLGVATLAGLLMGLSLGALGAGGSILAVPVLVYGLGESAAQATTGSLVVVGLTALTGAVTAGRADTVLLGRGLAFGGVAIGGAAVGARVSTQVPEAWLLLAFAALMLLVAGVMVTRRVRSRGRDRATPRLGAAAQLVLDEPIVSFRPVFACRCSRALVLVVTATAVGLLTGFLGVGGGFLVVPALMIALGLPTRLAAGTSLVVIAITSVTALGVRIGAGVSPDWGPVLVLAGAAMAGAYVGVRLAARTDTQRLDSAFTGLVLGVAAFTAWQALPALT